MVIGVLVCTVEAGQEDSQKAFQHTKNKQIRSLRHKHKLTHSQTW